MQHRSKLSHWRSTGEIAAYTASFMSSLPSGWSFNRASVARGFSSSKILQSYSNDTPVFDCSPISGEFLGLYLGVARTNSIRNSTAGGAVVGTPGTAPTNWGMNSGAGISIAVAGTGTENGMSYVDFRFYGTSSSTSGVSVQFEGNTAIAAVNGNFRSLTLFTRIVAGALTNINTIRLVGIERDSGGGSLLAHYSSDLKSQVSSTINRLALQYQCTHASCAYEKPLIEVAFSNGLAIDITLRMYNPQDELINNINGVASLPIVTSGAAVTCATTTGGLSSIPWYVNGPGTLFMKALRLGIGSTSSSAFFVSLDDGTVNNRITLGLSPAGLSRGVVQAAGIVTGDLADAAWNANTVGKLALSFDTNNFLMSFNGNAVVADTSGALPTGIDRMTLFQAGVGNCYLQEVRYYNKALTAAQLIKLTRG